MNTNNIGRVLVSLIVCVGFLIVTWMFVTQKAAGGMPSETLTLLVGALASNFTSVVAYWIGSSSGSTAKDEQLSKTTDKLAEKAISPAVSPVAAVVTSPPVVDVALDRSGLSDKM